MGYSTSFEGELKFTAEATAPQLVALKGICGEDVREHPEWHVKDGHDLAYIDLELASDFEGLKWDGSEKTREMVACVNLVISLMRERWPAFGLTGAMLAQGEDPDDAWALNIGPDGWATKQKVTLAGTVVTCPECSHRFRTTAA